MLNRRGGHALAEHHDVGLDDERTTGRTGHEDERILCTPGNLGVSVGQQGHVAREVRVGVADAPLELRSIRAAAALDALHRGERTVQFEGVRPGGRMKTIDVLRHEVLHETCALQGCNSVVAAVGPSRGETFPPDGAANPIASARVVPAEELLERHGNRSAGAVRLAVVGNARLGRETRPGEHEQVALRDELRQLCSHRWPLSFDNR